MKLANAKRQEFQFPVNQHTMRKVEPMNQQQQQWPFTRDIPLGGLALLSAAMLCGGLIVMTYFRIKPAIDEVQRIERSLDELLAKHGVRKNVDDVAHAITEDDQFREEIELHGQRRQFSYFVAEAEAWAPAVRVFTFRSIEDAAIACAKMGPVKVFLPGILECFVLLCLGGGFLLRLNTTAKDADRQRQKGRQAPVEIENAELRREADDLLTRASKAEISGNYGKARALYAEAVKRFPGTTVAEDAQTQIEVLKREGKLS